MINIRELCSQKVLEQKLINDNLLYIKAQDDEKTRLYIYHIIEPSFTTFLIKGDPFFKYSNQEEGKYAVDVIDSMLVVYSPILDDNNTVVDGKIERAYDYTKNEFVESYLLSSSFIKDYSNNLTSIQKKLGKMPTK